MKIAITGHTRGIGKAIFNQAKIKEYDVTGFSRSTNHDISLENLVDQISNFDIFVNNAYAPFYQTKLLGDMIQEWEGQDKLIVNISSKISLLNVAPPGLEVYFEDKKKQNEIMKKQSIRAYPRVLNAIIGLADTEMSKVYNVDTKMKPNHIAKLILDLIDIPNISMQQIVIDAPKFDWKKIKE